MISSVERWESRLIFSLLVLDQPLHAVERDAPIVADDPTPAVCIRQTGQDVRASAAPHVSRIGIEHGVVVCLAILAEGLDDLRIRLVPVRFQRVDDQAQAAVGHDRPLERRIGLKPDDDLVVLVDVTGRMGGDRAGNLRGSSTPLRRSSTNSRLRMSQMCSVRAVAGLRKDASPSYGA
jgi:hypothetical protein